MARRPVGRTLVRAAKRAVVWTGGSVSSTTVATGAVATATLVTENELETFPSPTIVRIHGDILLTVTAASAAGAQALISIGMIIQSARSIAAGVGGMPTPGGNIGSPWLFHKEFVMRSSTATPANNLNEPGAQVRFTVDNKSMRKVENNQGLVMVLQNTVIGNTISVVVAASFRVLLKK